MYDNDFHERNKLYSLTELITLNVGFILNISHFTHYE